MNTTTISRIEVNDALMRDGYVVRDDGGTGEILATAFEMPNGTLVPTDKNLVRHLHQPLFGVLLDGEKTFPYVKFVLVAWSDLPTEWVPEVSIERVELV